MARLHPASVRTVARTTPKLGTLGLLLFVALHAPLAIALKTVPYLSTLHAVSSLAIALLLVIRRYPTGWVVAGCAYLVGSETLWRMTGASVFWEFGKYSLLLVVILMLLLRRPQISSYLPVLYLALLVPGVLLTLISGKRFGELRQMLSYELSGPVAYAASSLFLLGQKLSKEEIVHCLIAMLASITGVATLTLFGLATTDVEFRSSSNYDASGGFGPNQVAAVLGLGIVSCFLLLTLRKATLFEKGMLIGLILWFAIQSSLTFSRSGLYYALSAMLAGATFLVSDVRRFVSIAILGLMVVVLGKFVIAPRLDAYTNGTLSARFESTDLSGRGDLMKGDLLVFLQHPVFGVGVGMARQERAAAIGKSAKSHTEFTRLLSEHGALGLAAIVLILVMSVQSVVRQAPGWPRAFSASLVAFALVFMTGSSMRLAIPSFLLAFAGVRVGMPISGPAKVQRVIRRRLCITKVVPGFFSRVFPKRPWQPR